MKTLTSQIEEIWKNYNNLPAKSEKFKHAVKIVRVVIGMVNSGEQRVSTRIKQGKWKTYHWVKKAIFLSFLLNKSNIIASSYIHYYDKIPPKFNLSWDEDEFEKENLRIVPTAYIREGSYIGKNTIIMPCFINIGAYIDNNTMIDAQVTIGSCAQIGKDCHISSGVTIGGVLEPVQSNPVIIEDNCFIGAGCNITEGVIIEEGSIIAMGVNIGASTKIINQKTGEVLYGRVPAYSVVIPGSIKSNGNNMHYACAVIIKKTDSNTRKKVDINELLR